MAPGMRFDAEDFDDSEEAGSRRGASPERANRQRPGEPLRKPARRHRTNEVAKRGMHQRRNKRMSW